MSDDLDRAVDARIDAYRPDRVPPFAALEVRRARKVRARSAAAVVLAAVAAAGVVVVPSLLADRDPLPGGLAAQATADGQPPEELTADGIELRRTGPAAMTGAHTDPADPSALLVYAGREDGDPYCSDNAVVRVVEQTAQTVVLDASAYKPKDPPPPNSGCSLALPPPKQHRLDLGIPLGGRRVLDAAGDRLDVLDTGTLLQPPALPDGYRLPGELTVGYGGTDDAGNDVTVHTYAGPDPRTTIEVYQGDPAKVPGRDEPVHPSVVIDRPTVRGHEGVVTETAGLDDLTCLRWREREDHTVTVCNRGYPPPLAPADLVAIAESMRPTSEIFPEAPPPTAHSGIDVNICLSGEDCRSLDPATSDRVRFSLGLDTTGSFPTVDPNEPACRAGSAVYTVKIHYDSGEPLEVFVPQQCGPMKVNGDLRPIEEAARAQVRTAYENAN
jgi:hypothetical protein